ncbi:hypothetical protein CUMW_095700 [Citrus unshiu]|uniref:CBF1-interacting co-repressor CIR N-terminal domain-containing protein n=1 Tax=Citrus unshiu TaxID=55188 RepID=A0A2H5P1M0_CITUN|nr:hypothetical protein CUMW_095700 [Citrus unshiu]
MEDEEGGGKRLKKASLVGSGEVDYKTKAGTAWSHSYLNQKPWHPLSYPNQRRKWIAEQMHSQRQRRTEEVTREYAQEQEFFRQTSLISKKDKEKMETMQAVSFMYVRPPGYNAESAKAAELEEGRKKQGDSSQEPASNPMQPESKPVAEEKKKSRPKDVFGRPLPTEEEFEILKNAPRLETGAPARVKPFGVEVRNVKCLRCGNFGHQSGDRECPLKDAIMPNEESRLKRDDPLTAIMAHVDPSEPLKWELKRQPGNFSPPRGGFKPDDPNQQIVAEDIFDEYGGFLAGDSVPDLLSSLSGKRRKKSKKKSKHKRQASSDSEELRVSDDDGVTSPSDGEGRRSKKEKKHKKKTKRNYSKSSSSDVSEWNTHHRKSRHKHNYSSEDSDSDKYHRSRRSRQMHSYSSEDDSDYHHMIKERRDKYSYRSEASDADRHNRNRNRKNRQKHYFPSEYEVGRHNVGEKSRKKHSHSSEDSDLGRHPRREKIRQKHRYTSADESDRHHRSEKSRHKHSHS